MNDEDDRTYRVVVNHEEQYSIWLDHKPVPEGWTPLDVVGSKSHCLDHIEEVWIDMRPLSVRQRAADDG